MDYIPNPSLKHCPRCDTWSNRSQFNKSNKHNDGLQSYCRTCDNATSIKYNHEVRGHIHMSENKTCAQYLGITVAERLVHEYFDDPIHMPNGHQGYDFICKNGFKIDVKSSCIQKPHNNWLFHINKNTIADYFLCIAFDNRTDLNVKHVWKFPGRVVNHRVTISSVPSNISKWAKFEQSSESIRHCCDVLKVGST